MQESHGKGPASHPDPESCVDGRKAGGEALTGAHAGQPSSCEIIPSGVPTPLSEAEGHTEIGLPVASIPVWPSASDNGVGTPDWMISQLDGWPACAPVNASPPALRPPTHDSGSGWLAGPFPCDSCIHDSSPVSRRTVGPRRAGHFGLRS